METIEEKIKKLGIDVSSLSYNSLIELSKEGYTRTGISCITHHYEQSKLWTYEAALNACLLYPNRVDFGNNSKNLNAGAEYVKLMDIPECVKNLIRKNVKTIEFDWTLLTQEYLEVSIDDEDAKALVYIVLDREIGDILPTISIGTTVKGKILISNKVEYSVLKHFNIRIPNISEVFEYPIPIDREIRFLIKNIKNIYLTKWYEEQKDQLAKFIKFEYKKDIICDKTKENIIKKGISKLILDRIEYCIYYKSSNGYRINLDPTIRYNVSNGILCFEVSISLLKNVKRVDYGVLFNLNNE